jgi:asparagine synthase (glutamine-hydrolysing)
MCGICGVVQLRGEPRQVVEPETLDRMTDAMTHRGPNDRGTHLAPGIAMGMRRLSIVDVAGGHQPFLNERRDVWAMQNGELYNHVDVRARLDANGHRLETGCDTEIIPHLYEEAGERFAEQLRGKFGIAVWDETRRRAVLARDRLGVKPLYYAVAGDLLVYASELKSLLASGLVDGALDYEAIDAYLTLGFVPAPRTPLAGVSKLLPGHYLVVEDGGHRVERYWHYPEPRVDDPRLRPEEYAEGLMERLEESVKLRLMSDVPLGAMLSGGLDSSLIVALMARNMSDPVKTFAVGFSDEHEVNELADARHVASVYGADHHELELSFVDDKVDLAELVWHLDEPVADLSALGFEAVSQLAARHVTVALSGQGADELLGGYKKHRAAALVGAIKRLPEPLTRTGAALALRGPARLHRAARTLAAPDAATRVIEMSGRLGGGLREALYTGPLEGRDGASALLAARTCLNGTPDDPLATTLHIDGQLALVDDMLHYFDRASMAHSLEVRVPFLDHEVVEYCARIPGDLKVRRLQTKYVLKQAATGIVPDRIVHKRKLGFLRGSSEAWLQAQLRDAARDYLLVENPRYAEFLDRGFVERLLVSHRDGEDTGNVHLLIAILMLELWLQTYLPRALAVREPAPVG